jgi:hypothetical protein
VTQLTAARNRLPDLGLLRHGRGLVLFSPHDRACAECERYAAQLKRISPELDSWGTDVAINVRDLEVALPAVLIVDQWGDIKASRTDAEQHDLLTPAEIESWARYLGTQCPECEAESL